MTGAVDEADETSPAAARRPGRPRSAVADRAILEAALEEYALGGLDGMSMEAVATRAGCGKATVYRRYASKVELVVAAAREVAEQVAPAVDTGTLRGDLLAIAGNVSRLVTQGDFAAIMAQAVADAQCDERLAAVWRPFVVERRAQGLAAVERAKARGDLSASTDADHVVDLLVAPLIYRRLWMGLGSDDEFLACHVDSVMRAVGAAAAAS
jgi:AcrR family transcriptional regulator